MVLPGIPPPADEAFRFRQKNLKVQLQRKLHDLKAYKEIAP